MEITNDAKEQAKRLIQEGATLPAQIAVAPHFFVARLEDSSIQSFGTVEVSDVFYKIGAKKVKHDRR